MKKSWIIAIVIAPSACAIEPEVEPRAAVTVVTAVTAVPPVTTIDGDPCPEWGCGENSPVMGPWRFHELDVNGAPNAEGIVLLDFQKDGVSYHPEILDGSQLIATSMSQTLTGTALTGGYLRVLTQGGTTLGAVYHINIVKVSAQASSLVRFWFGRPTSIETYQLTYSGPGGGGTTAEQPLCNSPPDSTPTTGPVGQSWVQPLEAILYSGDRYDAAHKLVTASSYSTSGGWFNIACAGSALAKLHLTRHTTAGSGPGYTATAAQRQAVLKMYVSDLCGTGHAWTRKGTPLHWTNAPQWSQLDGTEFAHEALWTDGGALCLDEHRLGALFDNASGFLGECTLPACPQVALGATLPLGAYLLSAVPANPGS